MSIFTQLKQQLSSQLPSTLSGVETQNGLVILQAEVALAAENEPLLGWLKAQKANNQTYPQFFWQARDRDLTIASLGSVANFNHLTEAQQFVEQQQQPLLGGLQFGGECYFLLPRLKLVQQAQQLYAYFILRSEELAQQAVIFEQFFANFTEIAPLATLNNPVISSESACDFNNWRSNIEAAIQAIQQQHFNKVVLANAKTLHFHQAIDACDLLAASQQTNLGCYHFIWAENAEKAFVGSSPERLYFRQDRLFHTEALAGTAAVTEDPIQTEQNAEWLHTDPKNVYENQLVVDDIAQNLADGITQLEVSAAEIKRLHNVQHLRRQIRATLNAEMNDSDCLARIHPTAAVAGLPRPAAKQFIAQHEPFKRNWYAGTLGFFSPEQAEFSVTLRSAQIEGNNMTLYAGAGIVEESEPMSEWQEIERKSLALAKLLQ